MLSAVVMKKFLPIATIALTLSLAACGLQIGDECDDSLDCAIDGTRYCDQTMPGGYCLIPNCRPDDCPEESVCVRYDEGLRARTFCMGTCKKDSDCRGAYQCARPGETEIPTAIIDLAPQGSRFCTTD
jgi:hypothetical protein